MDDYIKTELERGNIPPAIHEGLRLATVDKAKAAEFQRIMTEMTEELLGVQEARKLGVRFFVQDENYLNAAKLRYANPPIIIFTRALIEAFSPENLRQRARELRSKNVELPAGFENNGKGMLLGILAHELHHIERGNRNSEGIELACDEFAVSKLIELNYPKESLIDALEYVLNNPTKDNSIGLQDIRDYLDVHPVGHYRTAHMRNQAFKRHEGEGKLHLDPTGNILPPKLESLTPSLITASNVRYEIGLDKILQDYGYPNARTNVAKLRILGDIIENELPKWNERDHAPRVAVIGSLIKKLEVHSYNTQPDSQEKRELDRISDCILGVSPPSQEKKWYSESLYLDISESWHLSRLFTKPMGTYEKLAQHIVAFTEATDKVSALKAIQKIKALGLNKKSPSGIVIDLPSFKLPSKADILRAQQQIYKETNLVAGVDKIDSNIASRHGIKPQWGNHVRWALQDPAPANEITLMLYQLGIDQSSAPLLPALSEGQKKSHFQDLSKINSLQTIYAENGNIIGMNISEDSLWLDADLKPAVKAWNELVAERKADNLTVDEADWEMVRNVQNWSNDRNLETFLKKYHSLFLDTRNPHGNAFQKRFFQEVNDSLAANAQNPINRDYKNTLNSFFDYNFSNVMTKKLASSKQALQFDHPYISLVKSNPAQIMQPDSVSRICMLTIDPTLGKNSEKRKYIGERQNLSHYREIYGYSAPATPNEIFSLIAKTPNNQFMSLLAAQEADLFFRQHQEVTLSLDELAILYRQGKRTDSYILRSPYDNILSRYIKNHAEQELQSDPVDLIRLYNMHQDTSLFKDDTELRSRYESAIVQKVNETTDIALRKQLLDSIILAEKKPFSGKNDFKFIVEPNFRNWAIAAWVECTALTMKEAKAPAFVDEDTDPYFKEAKSVVEDVMARTEGITRH